MSKQLTVDDLAKMSDERLDEFIFDRLIAKMDDWGNQRQVVDQWSEPERTIYVINSTVGEVMNGGFNQFFFNSAGREFHDIAAECFRRAGAETWADIVERACQIIDSDQGDRIVARWGNQDEMEEESVLESFSASYKDNPLNELDKEMYALDYPAFLAGLIAYKRANLSAFADG